MDSILSHLKNIMYFSAQIFWAHLVCSRIPLQHCPCSLFYHQFFFPTRSFLGAYKHAVLTPILQNNSFLTRITIANYCSISLLLSSKIHWEPTAPAVSDSLTLLHPFFYRLHCTSHNSYVEALAHTITVFGDRTFKGIIKVKGGHKGGTQIQ